MKFLPAFSLVSIVLAAGCVEPDETDPDVAADHAELMIDPDPGDGPDPGAGSAPTAPSSSFKPIAKTASSVTMSWNAPANATSTRVQRRIGTGAWSNVRTYGATSGTVTYQNTGLTQDTRYCYRVVVANSYGSRTTTERCALTDRPNTPSFSRVRLELQVADVEDAGTDDKVGISLNDTYWSNFTGLSYSHDDLERNSTFRYDLDFRNLRGLHDIANITIKKYGEDGVCLRSFQLLLDEVPVFSRTFGNSASTCLWLDGSSQTTGQHHVGHAELRATPAFANFQPQGSLTVPQEEIEERLEGIMGNLIWNNDDVKWGHIYGEAVSVTAHSNLSDHLVVDYDLEGVGFGPNPEVDIDLHLQVQFVNNAGTWQLSFASTYFAANVDFDWWAEAIIALGTIVCGPVTGHDCVSLLEGHIEDRIEESFAGFAEAFDVETGPCPTPAVQVSSNGDLEFFCDI